MLRAVPRKMPFWSFVYAFAMFSGEHGAGRDYKERGDHIAGVGGSGVTLRTILVPDILSLYGFIAAVFLQDSMLVSPLAVHTTFLSITA